MGGTSFLQLIDGSGNFNDIGMNDFANKVELASWGISYAVVSIMGPRSSGRWMHVRICISQTTQGIWLGNSTGLEGHTLVMDLEGTDGNERGEDDTAFEKRSALFALAVSNVVLVNMWCTDVSRCQAANMPLLMTVFQVMLQLPISRKTTLFFVLRDQEQMEVSLEMLDLCLREKIQKLWKSIPKPPAHKGTAYTKFFNVEIVVLSSFLQNKPQFEEQMANLKLKIFNSIPSGGHDDDRCGAIDASSFSSNARKIWDAIKENKDLDLPAIRVSVAIARCEEIADRIFSSFIENKEWSDLKKAAQSGPREAPEDMEAYAISEKKLAEIKKSGKIKLAMGVALGVGGSVVAGVAGVAGVGVAFAGRAAAAATAAAVKGAAAAGFAKSRRIGILGFQGLVQSGAVGSRPLIE
ncbi:ROOT HAIR DEFECTIVE 3-like protein, partial [Drosera capensis]